MIVGEGVDSAIATIIESDEEVMAIKELTESLRRKYDSLEWENRNYRSSLRIIRKINNATKKSQEIDALCETEQERRKI